MRASNLYVDVLEPDLLIDPPRIDWELHLSDPEETGEVVGITGSREALEAVALRILETIGRRLEAIDRGET